MTERRVSTSDLKAGPIRHAELPPALVERIDSIRLNLEEVYSVPMENWLDGFQRDANPEREARWWEQLARWYLQYTSQKELNAEQRKSAFKVITGLALGSTTEEVTIDLAALPSAALDEMLAIMRRSTP